MLQLANDTPFQAERSVRLDRDGNQIWVVIVKATYSIASDAAPEMHGEQEPVCNVPAYRGEPGRSSLARDCEMVAEHPGTSVTLNATAYAPYRERIRVLDAQVEVGPLRAWVRIFGDRRWVKSGSDLAIGSPGVFESMPVCYENAYGGSNAGDQEWRNPVGKGFAAEQEAVRDQPLPNIENPSDPIRAWRDRPAPAGFGAIAPGWSPRKEFAGTFDAQWQEETAPLWPRDYDPRHQRSAHPSLIASTPLRGGEPVRLTHLTPEGRLSFALPKVRLTFDTFTKTRRIQQPYQMDRVIIEPDAGKLILVWRSALNCVSDARQVETTVIGTKRVIR